MLFASHIDSSYGYGFGAVTGRTLVKGTDFNCNTSICYGIGAANHALFQQLQTTLNLFAKTGMSAYSGQLVVDGFIGAGTVSAARAAAAAALLPSPGTTKEAVAANAQILNNGLQAFLAGINTPKTPTSPPLVTSAAPTSTSVPATVQTSQGAITIQPAAQPLPQAAAAAAAIPNIAPTSASAAAAVAPTASKIPLWVWIAGGAVGVLVVGGIGYAILRDPEPKAALARRRRRR